MANSNITLNRSSVSVLLAFIFGIGFIITPYWMEPSTQIGRIIILVLSLVIGGIWIHVSSSRFIVKWEMKKNLPYLILLISLLVVNFNSLISVIPWRGDEDYHISITLNLVNKIPQIAWGLIPFFVIIFVIVTVVKPKLGIIIGIILSLIIILIFFLWNPLDGINFLRYPFFNYWFYAIPPSVTSLLTTPYREFLFRIVPFLSSVTIAWMVYDQLPNKNKISRYLWGFAIGTVPLLFYYTSIFYLELPALALMLFVCFHIKDLINADYEEIKQIPAWYALILIGFIKETTIIFLLCFLASRYLFAYQNYRKIPEKNKNTFLFLIEELKIIFSVLGPIAVYLVFRSTLISDSRSFALQISNLWNISLYRILLTSFLEQFGLFLIFFLVGIFSLVRQKSYKEFVFLLFVFIGIPLFHILDYSQFTGYSRFNLFLLAPIFAGYVYMIKYVGNWNKNLNLLLVVATISVNLLLSPIKMDGTKEPLWGNYLVDTSEHYYPYKEALSWLKENKRDDQFIISGMYYRYKFNFYFNALNWWPNHTIIMIDRDVTQNEAISQVLAEAKNDGINIVLYQVTDEDLPDQQELCGFFVNKLFINQAHSLVVFTNSEK